MTCRKPKHDIGSVENIVKNYMRQKASIGGVRGKANKKRRS